MPGVLCLQGIYVYLKPPSLDQLRERVSADVLANPPLQHEPAEAAQTAADEAAAEASAAAARRELFDEMLVHDPQVRSRFHIAGVRAARFMLACLCCMANRGSGLACAGCLC
jgi:hypothetical protein